MKKMLFYGLLCLIGAVAGLFLYEGAIFHRYLAYQHGTDMNIPVNERAPVRAQGQITIAAPADTVWQVLARIDDWPGWQSDVTEAHLIGELTEGAEFRWKAGGLSFRSRIHTLRSATELGWTGTTIGASAIHNWFFQEENGQTIVRVEESLQGVFPRLFRKYFQHNLEAGIQQNLADLKRAAE